MNKYSTDYYFFKKVYYIVVLGILLSTAVLLSILISKNTVSAKHIPDTANRMKTIDVCQIQEGDSIWKIAERYYTPECGRFIDYVYEIKECNNLQYDKIIAGNYLIVPYYIEE